MNISRHRTGIVFLFIVWATSSAHAFNFVELLDFAKGAGKIASVSPNMARETFRLSEDAMRGMNHGEASEMEAALRGMSRYSTFGGHYEDVQTIKMLIDNYAKSTEEFDRTIPLSEKYPFFWIRANHSPEYDRALLSFAQSRLDHELAEPFDTNDLKIVTLAMADDMDRSGAEAARIQRNIGRDYFDNVGPLSRLSSPEYSEHTAKVRALAPYRGKTVVLVGHIPTDLNDFFVFANAGPTKVSIGDWMNAAEEAGVNLIPIGCNSERLADLGAKGIINSGAVLDRLQDVIRMQPKTIGDFFATLTSEDLVLVMNPFETKLFSNGVEIVERKTQQVVGRVIVQGARGLNEIWEGVQQSRTISGAGYNPCFALANAGDYDRCVRDVDALNAARQRQERRETETQQLAHTTSELNVETRAWAGSSLLYTVTWLVCSFFILHGLTIGRLVELENGPSLKALFSRNSINRSLLIAVNTAKRPFSNSAMTAIVFIPFLLGLSIFFIDPNDDSWLIVIVGFAGLFLGWMSLTMAWEAIKQESFALTVTVVAFVLWALAGYLQVTTAGSFMETRTKREGIVHELAGLKTTEHEDKVLLKEADATGARTRPGVTSD